MNRLIIVILLLLACLWLGITVNDVYMWVYGPIIAPFVPYFTAFAEFITTLRQKHAVLYLILMPLLLLGIFLWKGEEHADNT